MSTSKQSYRDSNSNDSLTTDGRRELDRRDSNARLLIVIDTAQFAGQADNFSERGVFFFSKENLRVQVHVEEDGVEKRYNGSIVRVQQMNDDETGFAVEFDRP